MILLFHGHKMNMQFFYRYFPCIAFLPATNSNEIKFPHSHHCNTKIIYVRSLVEREM